jgi:acyl-CoA synthetase (AMP-forming)/AMP-acid ligase II
MSTLLSGGTVVVPTKFNALSFWRTVREHRVTWYSGVPTMHQLLLARSRTKARGGCVAALHPFLQRAAVAGTHSQDRRPSLAYLSWKPTE